MIESVDVFPSFEALYASLPLLKCGCSPENVAAASPEDMEAYCSSERQTAYGVVGIEIRFLLFFSKS